MFAFKSIEWACGAHISLPSAVSGTNECHTPAARQVSFLPPQIAPKRAASKRSSSSDYLMAKIAKLDEEYSSLGEQVAQKQYDRDIATIVLELQEHPEK